MRRTFTIVIATTWLSLAIAASADNVENPYGIIADRNIFALRSPSVAEPLPPKPVVEPESPLRLTGVAFLEGKRWALLVKEKRGQNPEHLTLQEGQKVGDLEVRDVNVENEEVRVIISGKDQVLSFAAQGAETRAARQAEKQFVEEHTRAHEELQRRERARLARESIDTTRR